MFQYSPHGGMLRSIMDPSKTQIVQDIESAKAHLEKALHELIELPVPTGSALEMATNTLGSYVVLAQGTVDLLREELREYPVRDVHIWLDGLARGTNLMEQLVGQIRSGNIARQELKLEDVEIATLMRRLCRVYRDIAARRSVNVRFDAAVTTSRAWTDRIVAASLFQQILANTLKRAPANSTIEVLVEELHDAIITSIQNLGDTLSSDERCSVEENGDVSKAEDFGLRVPRESVERLGGKLWCKFDAGEGFRVNVSLPKPGNSVG